jgi:hypothetical protein
MSRAVLRLAFFAFLALGTAQAGAGTFDVTASVDNDHVELGEPFHLTIGITTQGQMDFPPQLDAVDIKGFTAQGGPQDGWSSSWVNGAVTQQQTHTWELVAQAAGVQTLGPFRVSAKDAANGTIVKTAPAIRITVSRPKNAFVLPSAQPTPANALPAGAVPPPDDSELRGIKGDRPLPWLLLGLIAAGVLGLGGLLFWLWWKPKPAAIEAVPRDPAQLALQQLEQARQALAPGGELAFTRVAAGLLRQYLRHKLSLRTGVTLSEALRAVRFQPAGAQREERDALRLRLDWLLYGGQAVEPADADEVYQRVRAQIIELERIIIPPAPQPASPPPTQGVKRTRKR